MQKDYKKELDELINVVIKEGGSDLHISEGRHPTIRVSGFLIPLVKKPVFTRDDTYGILGELLNSTNKELFLKNKEIDFSYDYVGSGTTQSLGKAGARFRGNGFFQQGSVSVALRLIPRKIRSIEELNLPPLLDTFIKKLHGFFLVVGPVGHGKTTTLASLVERINESRAEHIITIEDPIEYVMNKKGQL